MGTGSFYAGGRRHARHLRRRRPADPGTGASGAPRVCAQPRSSPDASYLYNGTAAQATGAGLPTQRRSLTTSNPSP